MPIIDLTDPAELAKAVSYGYIWSAPNGAIEEACARIADGTIPMPQSVPEPWNARNAELAGGTLPPPAPTADPGVLA